MSTHFLLFFCLNRHFLFELACFQRPFFSAYYFLKFWQLVVMGCNLLFAHALFVWYFFFDIVTILCFFLFCLAFVVLFANVDIQVMYIGDKILNSFVLFYNDVIHFVCALFFFLFYFLFGFVFLCLLWNFFCFVDQ